MTLAFPISAAELAVEDEKYTFNPDDYRWSALFYYGWMTEATLNEVLRFQYKGINPSVLYSAELSYQLQRDNLIRRIFQPLVSTIDFAVNFTYMDDPVGDIYQINPYIMLIWNNFPWNDILLTQLAIGEGFSYSSRIPQRELRDTTKAKNSRRFLNYLMFEAAFALPEHPEWQLVYRLHHRSGVFGLYSPGIVGSTAVGVAIRYKF